MEFMKSLAPFGVMVLYEFGEVVMTILAKAAMNSGISNFSYLVYYNVLGFILFLPYFFFQYYRSRPSPLTLPLLFRCFILGLVGYASRYTSGLLTADRFNYSKCVPLLGLVGLDYGSPDMSAALGNLTVTFTFLLAVIFKMEKLDLRNSSSQAKSLGSTIAVSGALVMTLYKGPPLMAMNDEPSSNTLLPRIFLTAQPNRWALGGLLLTINYFFCSAWSVIQTSTVKKYTQETTILFFFLLFGSMQCAIVSATVERNLSAWKLHPGIQIIAVIYSAIFGTGISYILITWCLKARGPLYVAMFKPLGVVLTDLCAIIFLGDKLHLGSLIGTIMIGAGFYTVLWGQAKEKEEAKLSACKVESSTQDIDTPLLKDYNAYET